jgi:hypothetical protein
METKFYRVLEQSQSNQIRIGAPFYGTDMNVIVDNVVKSYEKENSWCGGFLAACEKYYQRIAIVDSETLQIVRVIYSKK